MARAECELFDTWTKEKNPFSVQPSQEEKVDNLPPAEIMIYVGQTGDAAFVNFSGILKWIRVTKSTGPGQPSEPVDEIHPAIITGSEILTAVSELHNEILRVRLVDETTGPNPGQQSDPTI